MPNILLVENDRAQSVLFTKYLTDADYTVTLAQSGDEGLGIYQARKADLDGVVTNHPMPIIDGIGLCRQIREDDSEMPLIMMTTYATVELVIEALRIPVNDFFTIPFKAKNFVASIEKLVPPYMISKQRQISRRWQSVERRGD